RAVGLDKTGLARLYRSLDAGITPMRAYRALAHNLDLLSDTEVRDLIKHVASRQDGFDFAVEMLSARLHYINQQKQVVGPALIHAGEDLLRDMPFSNDHQKDHYLSTIASSCLKRDEGAMVVYDVCRRLRESVAQHHISAFYYGGLLHSLFALHHGAALD